MFIADWLSRHNQTKIKDEEIPGMSITISIKEPCMDMQDCMTAEEIRSATVYDEHLSML